MKSAKKALVTAMAAAVAFSSTVCVSAADETIALTLWGAEEDQDLLKELVGK